MENEGQQISSQVIIRKQTNKYLLFMVVLFFMCLSGVVGYFVWRQTRENVKNQTIVQPTMSAATGRKLGGTETSVNPTGVPISVHPTLRTGNWKTVANMKYGILFKYPSTWNYKSGALGNGDANTDVFEFMPNNMDNPRIAFVVGVFFYIHTYSESFRANLTGDTGIIQEPITVGNLHGVHEEGFADPQKDIDGVYILDKDGKAIEFKYISVDGYNYGQEAEQMMKSLVFQKN